MTLSTIILCATKINCCLRGASNDGWVEGEARKNLISKMATGNESEVKQVRSNYYIHMYMFCTDALLVSSYITADVQLRNR